MRGCISDHDARYEVTDEFLTVWKPLLDGREVNFEGRHLKIIGGRLLIDRECKPNVPLYFGGSSDAAIEVAARHVDLYLTWGEPPAQAPRKSRECASALPSLAARSGSECGCI